MGHVTRFLTGPEQFDLRAAERARDRLQGSEISGRPVSAWCLYGSTGCLDIPYERLMCTIRFRAMITEATVTKIRYLNRDFGGFKIEYLSAITRNAPSDTA
jgi:hypothetical protein